MKIQIPTPCHENWEAMKPGEHGRYCGTCCKTVVDFTGMTPSAISAYLVQHHAQKICGRFTETQLAVEYDADFYIAATHIARSGWPLMKKIAAVFILFFGLSQAGNAQVAQKELQQVIVTGGTKRTGKIVPKADPFTATVPQSAQPLVQCIEGKVGGVVIKQSKKQAKRKLKKLQKQQQKKEPAVTPLTGDVMVVAGMVQTN